MYVLHNTDIYFEAQEFFVIAFWAASSTYHASFPGQAVFLFFVLLQYQFLFRVKRDYSELVKAQSKRKVCVFKQKLQYCFM